MLISAKPGSLGVVVCLAATVVACGGSPSGGGAGGGSGGAMSGAGGAAGGPGGSAGASSSRGGAGASGGLGGGSGDSSGGPGGAAGGPGHRGKSGRERLARRAGSSRGCGGATGGAAGNNRSGRRRDDRRRRKRRGWFHALRSDDMRQQRDLRETVLSRRPALLRAPRQRRVSERNLSHHLRRLYQNGRVRSRVPGPVLRLTAGGLWHHADLLVHSPKPLSLQHGQRARGAAAPD